MVKSVREEPCLNIVLNTSNFAFASNFTYFLYGWENTSRDNSRTIFIDFIHTTILNNTTKLDHTVNGNGLSHEHELVALGIEEIQTCDKSFLDCLTATFKTTTFDLIPISDDCGGKKNMVIIPQLQCTKVNYKKFFVISMNNNIPLIIDNSRCLDHLGVTQIINERTKYSSSEVKGSAHIAQIFNLLLLSILWLMNFVVSPKFASVIYNMLQYARKYLCIAKQMLYRLDQISAMIPSRKRGEKTRCANSTSRLVSIIIDIMLGVIVVNFLLSTRDFLSISTWLVGQKYLIAEYLQSLLKWIMGVPAGLKLNKPLNQFLGNFYTYHIHLWTSYLYFIEPYLPNLVWLCLLFGYFGITFLLSIISDVLSLLTIHIYCFYIYAAKLYKFEIHALLSLLRLFAGKKWNILRNRVDSLEYDVDRLFIGTLLFTILLFLFPTIFLYYIVFTTLRLVVLLIQALLTGTVAIISSFPFWHLWLFFMNPEKLPGQPVMDINGIKQEESSTDVHQNILFIKPDIVLYLLLKHNCLSIRNVFSNCCAMFINATYYDIFGGKIVSKFLYGQLFGNTKNTE